MERLIDRVRVRGRDYRIIEDLETGATKVASAKSVTELPNRQAAYQLVGQLFRRLAIDFGQAAPGAEITLPMADGSTKSVTVMMVTNTDITVIDKDTGEQMTIPKTTGPAVQQQPGEQQSGTGVVVQGPGYGTTQGKRLALSNVQADTGAPAPDPNIGGTGRRLTRHEIVEEAETLIRNALAKGTKIGLEELTAFMAQQYSNARDELYAGAKMAWDKVQWEGSEGGTGGPPTLEEVAEPAQS